MKRTVLVIRAVLAGAVVVIMTFVAALPAFAQSSSSTPCANDIKEYCGEVSPGGGRLLRCYEEKKDKMSSACRAWAEHAKANGAIVKAACSKTLDGRCNFEKGDPPGNAGMPAEQLYRADTGMRGKAERVQGNVSQTREMILNAIANEEASMRMLRAVVVTMLLMSGSVVAAEAAPAGKQENISFTLVEVSTVTAKVTDIDRQARTVQLTDDEGKVRTVKVADHVSNFKEVRKGDTVTMDVDQNITVEVQPGPGDTQNIGSESQTSAAPGQKPASIRTIEGRLKTRIESIDYDKRTNKVQESERRPDNIPVRQGREAVRRSTTRRHARHRLQGDRGRQGQIKMHVFPMRSHVNLGMNDNKGWRKITTAAAVLALLLVGAGMVQAQQLEPRAYSLRPWVSTSSAWLHTFRAEVK